MVAVALSVPISCFIFLVSLPTSFGTSASALPPVEVSASTWDAPTTGVTFVDGTAHLHNKHRAWIRLKRRLTLPLSVRADIKSDNGGFSINVFPDASGADPASSTTMNFCRRSSDGLDQGCLGLGVGIHGGFHGCCFRHYPELGGDHLGGVTVRPDGDYPPHDGVFWTLQIDITADRIATYTFSGQPKSGGSFTTYTHTTATAATSLTSGYLYINDSGDSVTVKNAFVMDAVTPSMPPWPPSPPLPPSSPPPVSPPPLPPTPPPFTTVAYDFEDGTLQGWKIVDACHTYRDGVLRNSYGNSPQKKGAEVIDNSGYSGEYCAHTRGPPLHVPP